MYIIHTPIIQQLSTRSLIDDGRLQSRFVGCFLSTLLLGGLWRVTEFYWSRGGLSFGIESWAAGRFQVLSSSGGGLVAPKCGFHCKLLDCVGFAHLRRACRAAVVFWSVPYYGFVSLICVGR
jgi:hypothetical protein